MENNFALLIYITFLKKKVFIYAVKGIYGIKERSGFIKKFYA